MKNLEECRPYVEHLRAEHRQLQRNVQGARKLFSDRGHRRFAKWLGELRETLATLETDLARHFTEEDEGGCIEEAVCRCPTLSGEAATIEKQHGPLLSRLQVINQHLRQANSVESIAEVANEFSNFAVELRSHEGAENRILQRAFGAHFDLIDNGD